MIRTLIAIVHGMPGGGVKPANQTAATTQRPGQLAGPAGVPPVLQPQQIAAIRQYLAALGGALGAPGAPGVGAPRAFAFVIRLDEIYAIVVPLFFLSFKLAFLLYIFGRHASSTKRFMLVSLCVAYVIYEGFAIRRRRVAAAARAQAELGQQIARRARRAAANAPGQAGAAAGGDDAGAAAGAGDGAARPVGRVRRSGRHAQPASKWTVKYWANMIAHVGLEAEARDMGIAVNPPVPGAPIPPGVPTGPDTVYAGRVLPARAISRSRRIVHAIWVGTVLFVGTLIPEVEKRRKKALERRERLRSQLQAAREQALSRAQQRAEATAAAASSIAGPSTSAAIPVEEPVRVPTPLATIVAPDIDRPPPEDGDAAPVEEPVEPVAVNAAAPEPAQAEPEAEHDPADDDDDEAPAAPPAEEVDAVGAELFPL